MKNLTELVQEAEFEIHKAGTDSVLDMYETKWLGRKGRLTEVLRNLKNTPEKDRKTLGQEANRAKGEIENLIQNRRAELQRTA